MGISSNSDLPGFPARLRAALQAVQGELSLSQLVILLLLVERPGLSIGEVAEITSLPQQTASRLILQLSGRYQIDPGGAPVEYIRQEVGDDDPRKRALFLTDKGEAVLTSIFKNLEKK